MDTKTITKPNGASACSIAARLAMIGKQDGSYPMDAGDFGRCEAFLTKHPELRDNLHLMADVNAYWQMLVPVWDVIRAAPEDQRTALIRLVIEPLHKVDPTYIKSRGCGGIRFGAVKFKLTDETATQAATTATMTINTADGPQTLPFDKEVLLQAIKDQLKGKPKMKHDPDFAKAADHAYAVTADELRQFIERFEQLALEKAEIADQQKEVMAEAKGRGYDTRVIRKIIALRKRKADDIAEEEAVMDLYKSALGMS